MHCLGIIPARYGSTRLAGKPLMEIAGKPMIRHVYERAMQALPEAYVATDSPRIVEAVEAFGGKAVLTSARHENGTSRCKEAVDKIMERSGQTYDCILNIQGDEPLLSFEQLNVLMACFAEKDTEMATLAIKASSAKELFDPSECFVVLNTRSEALYFSRAIIPFVRGVASERWLEHHTFYIHVGLYAYSYECLSAFTEMPPSSLEKAEMLEQNRWLEAGGKIRVAFTDHRSYPVDTMEDLEKVRQIMERSE